MRGNRILNKRTKISSHHNVEAGRMLTTALTVFYLCIASESLIKIWFLMQRKITPKQIAYNKHAPLNILVQLKIRGFKGLTKKCQNYYFNWHHAATFTQYALKGATILGPPLSPLLYHVVLWVNLVQYTVVWNYRLNSGGGFIL